MPNYGLLDDITHVLFTRKEKDEDLIDSIVYILKHLEVELPKKRFEKVIKGVRHSINRKLNFGEWEAKQHGVSIPKVSVNRDSR